MLDDQRKCPREASMIDLLIPLNYTVGHLWMKAR